MRGPIIVKSKKRSKSYIKAKRHHTNTLLAIAIVTAVSAVAVALINNAKYLLCYKLYHSSGAVTPEIWDKIISCLG